MNRKLTFLLAAGLIWLIAAPAISGPNRQEIDDFYLSNLKPDGTSDWEIKGKTAVLDGDFIDILAMDADYYLEEDTINVKSNTARLNKKTQNMHLNGNVRIKNQQGWILKTNYLDWQREKNYIQTTSAVETTRDSFLIMAKGLEADSLMERADFQEEVEVSFADPENNTTTINCDGPLEIEYGSGKATFKNNVVVRHQQGTLYSDTATLFFDTQEDTIIKIISDGNVKIIGDNNITFAEKATYFAQEERLILEGKPRLIYFPESNN